MRTLAALLVIILAVVSCRKDDASDFLWQMSFGSGAAYFVAATADSGILGCGETDGKPFLVKINSAEEIETEYSSVYDGSFTTAWEGPSFYIAAGSSNGEMLLERISDKGIKVWDKTIAAGFPIGATTLVSTGEGAFLATGVAAEGSEESGTYGILFVRFDTTGYIIDNKEIADASFISATGTVNDTSGDIYLALTRLTAGAKTKAAVARYNSDFQKIWETELYNNPEFGAASAGILKDASGNIFVTGKTEVSRTDGTLENSFLASLGKNGNISWKKYVENSNSGAAITFLNNGEIMVLNRNCFILNTAGAGDGSITGRLSVFSVCDPYNTDAFGFSLDIDFEGNIIAAGAKSENFFVAVKSARQ